jgi:superfamily II DNA helicase RecQ
MKVVQAILEGKKHIASIAATGMGKTLTFWMPLLFKPKGYIQVIVTPLNILGKQNVASKSLAKAGFKSIFINADSATGDNFRVSSA